jgi:hypothetical protein
MTQSKPQNYIQTVDRAITLLKRAKLFFRQMVCANHATAEQLQWLNDIDDFMARPVDIQENQFHLTVQDTAAKSFNRSMGLDMHRCMELVRDILDAFRVDLLLDYIMDPQRPKCGLARILNRATQNCRSVQETIFVTWMVTLAYEQTTQDFTTAVRMNAQKSIH